MAVTQLRLPTAEPLVQSRATSCEIRGGPSDTEAGVFSYFIRFPPVSHHATIAPHSSATPPPEMCDSPDHAAHYHILGP
jgi:hypothetical protein